MDAKAVAGMAVSFARLAVKHDEDGKEDREIANSALRHAFNLIHEATGEEEIKILKQHGIELWSTRHREDGLGFEVYNCRTEEPYYSRLFSEAYENFNAQVVTEIAAKP